LDDGAAISHGPETAAFAVSGRTLRRHGSDRSLCLRYRSLARFGFPLGFGVAHVLRRALLRSYRGEAPSIALREMAPCRRQRTTPYTVAVLVEQRRLKIDGSEPPHGVSLIPFW